MELPGQILRAQTNSLAAVNVDDNVIPDHLNVQFVDIPFGHRGVQPKAQMPVASVVRLIHIMPPDIEAVFVKYHLEAGSVTHRAVLTALGLFHKNDLRTSPILKGAAELCFCAGGKGLGKQETDIVKALRVIRIDGGRDVIRALVKIRRLPVTERVRLDKFFSPAAVAESDDFHSGHPIPNDIFIILSMFRPAVNKPRPHFYIYLQLWMK